MMRKTILWARIISAIFGMLSAEINRRARYVRTRLSGTIPPPGPEKNIVIVGFSFAGWFATRTLAQNLPPNSGYRIIVVEPNSHFQFSWVLPRFCVVEGHEHKAFIPYDGFMSKIKDSVTLLQDRVVTTTPTHVVLQNGEKIPYEYLIVATGAEVKEGLPSRVNHAEKAEGILRLQEIQAGIKAAKSIVVVGGGAAGVEVATDAKDLYPEKNVTIVHSRDALMNRFGKSLQDEALEGMKKLGVEVILGERVVEEDAAAGTVTLRSGRVIECDKFINCTGQKPASGMLQELSPKAIASDGHISVKPTLQVADDRFPNIYVCGDVADTKVPTPNARAAARQAAVACDNILAAMRGQEPTFIYEYSWPIDSFIKLTLGLHRSTTYMGDGEDSVMFRSKEGDDLMSKHAWKQFGAQPFEDSSYKTG
ncbi:FAD/NAD(P)-binding domain-containing protein [Sarocladium strictum]